MAIYLSPHLRVTFSWNMFFLTFCVEKVLLLLPFPFFPPFTECLMLLPVYLLLVLLPAMMMDEIRPSTALASPIPDIGDFDSAISTPYIYDEAVCERTAIYNSSF